MAKSLPTNDFFLEDADDILGRDKPVEEVVVVPEWRKPADPADPRILVRSFRDGLERQSFEAHGVNENVTPGDDGYLNRDWWSKVRRYELVARCAVRRDGTPIFSLAQVERLAGMQPKPIERLFQAAQRVNGYDSEDLRKTGKGSPAPVGGALLTGSPGTSASTTPDAS